MTRCHDGQTYLIGLAPTVTEGGRDTIPLSEASTVAVCCATCNTVLRTGPRTEVYGDV